MTFRALFLPYGGVNAGATKLGSPTAVNYQICINTRDIISYHEKNSSLFCALMSSLFLSMNLVMRRSNSSFEALICIK